MEHSIINEGIGLPLKVHWYCGNCLVWDSDCKNFPNNCSTYEAVFTLRTKYRIMGTLIGTMPQFLQQNIYNGLPLLLSNEEVSVLLQYRIVKLLDATFPFPLPTPNEIEQFHKERR